MGKYFGTDGFRGVAGRELTGEHAWQIGRFLGNHLQQDDKRPRVVLGKDTRRSGDLLEAALAAGLCASGADVWLLGVTTTPCVAFITEAEGFDAGVMISASHNPYQDNGIKLIGADGGKMPQETLEVLEAWLDRCTAAPLPAAEGAQIGVIRDHSAGQKRYLDRLCRCAAQDLSSLRIGLDCANGSAWQLAPQLYRQLGAKVQVIHASPDGCNINREAGSTHIEALRQLVRQQRLDVGLAFDGDADRCLAVDENGQVVTGDHLLYLFATALQARGALPENTVAVTVQSNLGLHRALRRHGIRCCVTDVGDKYVAQAMAAHGYALGGEQSGHIIFRELATAGDGLLTGILLLDLLAAAGQPLSVLTAPVRLFPQIDRSIPVTDRQRVLQSAAVQDAKERLARQLGETGRILLRPSGTEPVVRLMVECEDAALCREAAETLEQTIRKEAAAQP